MIRMHIEYCPYSQWFHYGAFGEGIRDLGDFYLTVFRFQFTFWIKKPYYNKRYAKHCKAMKAVERLDDKQ